MKCQDFREIIDSYLSDELLTETNHGVLRHLEQCGDCRSVIEERRAFRARLRAAVLNSAEFEISEKFATDLRASLRESIRPQRKAKAGFWNMRLSLATVAAGLLIFAGFGFLQNFGGNPQTDDLAGSSQPAADAYFQKIALGDHKMCAVDHDPPSQPFNIDLTAAQNASLEKGIVQPLENAAPGQYELVATHFCKFKGQTFAHLIYRHNGKMMSVQVTDLPDGERQRSEYINNLSLEGYQITYFDVDKKGVFVISDMPEKQNMTTAEILEKPLRKELSTDLGLRIWDLGFEIRNPKSQILPIIHRNTRSPDV